MIMWYRFLLSIFLISCSFLSTSCNSKTTIAHGLPSREANEIVVLLSSKGILAEKIPVAAGTSGGGQTEQMWNISVPGARTTEALSILNQAGLPRLKGTSLLDLFAKQGLVPSELQERIRYQEGLSEQLATTIRKMDGIIDANVQISFPQDNDDSLILTASVYIKHRGVLDNPNSVVVSKIKRLVASAIPGLESENVSVIGDRASYSEIALGASLSEDAEQVSVWGITLLKMSVLKFRVIFYCLILALFLSTSLLIWMIWKHHLIINQIGGFKTLLDPSPYTMAPVEKKETPQEDAPAEETASTPEDNSANANKDEAAANDESNDDNDEGES